MAGFNQDGGFKIVDSNGQALAYVYGHADPRDAQVAKALTIDEARRRIASNAKLPSLLPRRKWYAAKYAELAPDQREAEQTAFAEAVKANRDRLDDAQVTA